MKRLTKLEGSVWAKPNPICQYYQYGRKLEYPKKHTTFGRTLTDPSQESATSRIEPRISKVRGTSCEDCTTKACFIRRISVASNAIQKIDDEKAYLIIYCLNCIRRDRNSTYKTGPRLHIKLKYTNSHTLVLCWLFFTIYYVSRQPITYQLDTLNLQQYWSLSRYCILGWHHYCRE